MGAEIIMKKSGKIFIIVGLVVVLAAGGGYFFWSKNVKASEKVAEREEIVLEAGQTLKYAKITAISGNDMTYVEVEEKAGRGSRGERPKMPEGFSRGEGDEENGERPKMPEGFSSGQSATYSETGESGTIQIPVGTEVETKLGTVTTFSKLRNGDIIKMLLQEENGEQVIMKIWMVQ